MTPALCCCDQRGPTKVKWKAGILAYFGALIPVKITLCLFDQNAKYNVYIYVKIYIYG